ncbi:MAG TPA: MoxR family ATPase [Planctomycetota bacterium]|nr:MoxR family ATPase [Planctomycetota bacterium]HRR81494.1 MoxR family ATPase [Planctomycetota bacterium]HRT94364.1 MoxR family ATPase [Planctomycetota bacterium]
MVPADLHDKTVRLQANIERVFIGKPEAVRLVLVGLFAGGHILIEDVPGVGKTTLARALARSIRSSFRRIQFTPDLLPTDILGVPIYNEAEDCFIFKPGPIFANVVLADEINRTTPRTQSSLLEAMNEAQVSVDGATHPLPHPFIVLATQNPHEFEGTFPLPESQLDRFLMRIEIGYPSRDDERRVLATQRLANPLDTLEPVLDGPDVVALQAAVREVRVDDSISDYILEMVARSRQAPELEIGVSPRGGLALSRAAQALALLDGRGYVSPDDVKRLAVPVLAHRVIRRAALSAGKGATERQIIRQIVQATPVPV